MSSGDITIADGFEARGFIEFFSDFYDSPDVKTYIGRAGLLILGGKQDEGLYILDSILESAKRCGLQSPKILKSPIFHFLTHLAKDYVGEQTAAQSALDDCIELGGSKERCLNDLAAILGLSGQQQNASKLISLCNTQDMSKADRLVIHMNEFWISLQVDVSGHFEELSDKFSSILSDVANLLKEDGKNENSWITHKDLVEWSIVNLLRLRSVAGVNVGEALQNSVHVLLDVIGRLRTTVRDEYVFIILLAAQDEPQYLSDLLKKTGIPERSDDGYMYLALRLGVDFALLAETVRDDCLRMKAAFPESIIPNWVMALLWAEDGELDEEYEEISAILKRYPNYHRALFYAANNRYRKGLMNDANELAKKAISLTSNQMSEDYFSAKENAALLDQAISLGQAERNQEVDPYVKDDWVEQHWHDYHHQLQNYTYRQDPTAAINHCYKEELRCYLRSNDIRSVVNFGAFCGYIDDELAQEFPEIQFFGYDRCERAIELSQETFRQPNLSFSSGDFKAVLLRAVTNGKTLLSHIRTISMMYPAGVQDLYETCFHAGISTILGVEASGYSFQLDQFVDPKDTNRPAVSSFGVMTDHNVLSLTKEAGYQMVRDYLHPNLFLCPIRVNQERNVLRAFIAERVA